MTSVAGAVRRRLHRLRLDRRPLPLVEVTVGPWVPGWVFRLAACVAVGALVLLAAGRTGLLPTIAVGAALLLAAWAAARPGPGPAHVAVVASAVILLGTGTTPFDAAVLWLAPLGYVAVRLGWWASWLGPLARVEVAALGRAAARDAVVVLATFPVALAAWVVAGRPVAALVVLGFVALAAFAWIIARRHDGR
ncbi:hypothetical protein LEP48_15570 [Isoptericola sp. NEAU-Y5]|uniref:Uncharacterized protein n=1 Tax=Isoptericola luteus TaxID=2879484 RepID=A0ABS7ZIB4_9MICO|nr:hypothetical protein [Isoptericola sp. NEAU-Y5]MCA5894758.1 hypothetical protein [Isoptericola sp. NEAU-Y5]